MSTKLITKSAQLLTNRGFIQLDSIRVKEGIHSTVFKRGEEVYLVASKKYAFKNLASFQTSQVGLALRNGVTLIFYEDKDETFTAFDPRVVNENAKQSQGQSKRADRTWQEIDLSYGVPLRDWLNGKRYNQEEGQAGLGAFQ